MRRRNAKLLWLILCYRIDKSCKRGEVVRGGKIAQAEKIRIEIHVPVSVRVIDRRDGNRITIEAENIRKSEIRSVGSVFICAKRIRTRLESNEYVRSVS